MTREQINAILEGLDGVTPGPWRAEQWDDGYQDTRIAAPSQPSGIAKGIGDSAEVEISLAHIARCDPSTIRALCEMALRALRYESVNPSDFRYWEGRYRDEAAEVDRLRAENERLRSDLEAEQRIGRELYRKLNAALERKPE